MFFKRLFVTLSVLLVLAAMVYSFQIFFGVGGQAQEASTTVHKHVSFLDSDKKIPIPIAPHVPLAQAVFFPVDGRTDLNPGEENPKITLDEGILDNVVLLSSTGAEIAGEISEDKKVWKPTETLAMSTNYSFRVLAFDNLGRNVVRESSFATFDPPNGVNGMAIYPLNGMLMGVGQPVSISFKYPITDRSVVENAINISNSSGQLANFHWLNDYTVRYRAESFWNSGNVISIEANLLGVDLGEGRFGSANRSVKFTVGSKRIATVDDERKVLVVRDNDVTVREIPVSLGMDRFPTPQGIHIVAETHRNLTMDSTTWGLSNSDPDGYRTEVEYATRISDGGVFIHAAPWALADLGKTNISHGCLNMSTDDAKWVSENMRPGDVIDIKGTKGGLLEFGDGFGGDWNVPWNVWSAK